MQSAGLGRKTLILALAWLLTGVLLGAQAYVSEIVRGRPVPLERAMTPWLAFAGLWALLTPLVLDLHARVPFARPGIPRAVAVHTLGAFLIVSLQLAGLAAVAPYVGASYFSGTWIATFRRVAGAAFLLNIPVYVAIVGIGEIRRLARAEREREAQARTLESLLTEAQLLTLRSQLQPHFLFNTLNTIAVLIHEDVELAHRMVLRLGSLLRRSLESSSRNEISLRSELELVTSYLEIERTRFGDRLAFEIRVDADTLDLQVPSFVLQPLVENAIRHGIGRRAAPGRLVISAAADTTTLRLTVSDDGPGLAHGYREGVGLANTRARLEHMYGRDQVMELRRIQDETVASIAIPRTPRPR